MGFGQEDHKNAILITFVAYIPSAWLITVGVKSQPYHLVVISVLSGFPTEKLLFCFFMPFHSVVVGSHSAWPILQGSKAPLLEGAVSIDFLEFICTGDWSLSTNQILLPNGLRNLFFLSFFNISGIVGKGLWARTSIVSQNEKVLQHASSLYPLVIEETDLWFLIGRRNERD